MNKKKKMSDQPQIIFLQFPYFREDYKSYLNYCQN